MAAAQQHYNPHPQQQQSQAQKYRTATPDGFSQHQLYDAAQQHAHQSLKEQEEAASAKITSNPFALDLPSKSSTANMLAPQPGSPLQQLLDAHQRSMGGLPPRETERDREHAASNLSSPSMQSSDSKHGGRTASSSQSQSQSHCSSSRTGGDGAGSGSGSGGGGQHSHSTSSTSVGEHDPFREALDRYHHLQHQHDDKSLPPMMPQPASSSKSREPSPPSSRAGSSVWNSAPAPAPAPAPAGNAFPPSASASSRYTRDVRRPSEAQLVHHLEQSLGLKFDDEVALRASISSEAGGTGFSPTGGPLGALDESFESSTALGVTNLDQWIPNRQLNSALQTLHEQQQMQMQLQAQQMHAAPHPQQPWPPQRSVSSGSGFRVGGAFRSDSPSFGSSSGSALGHGPWSPHTSFGIGTGVDAVPMSKSASNSTTGGASSGAHAGSAAAAGGASGPFNALLSAHARKTAAALAASHSQPSLPATLNGSNRSLPYSASGLALGATRSAYDMSSSPFGLGHRPGTPSALTESGASTPYEAHYNTSADLFDALHHQQPSSPAMLPAHLQQPSLRQGAGPGAGGSYFAPRRAPDPIGSPAHSLRSLPLQHQQSQQPHTPWSEAAMAQHDSRPSSRSQLHRPQFAAVHAATAAHSLSVASSPVSRTATLAGSDRRLRSRSLIGQDGSPSMVDGAGPDANDFNQWLPQAFDSLSVRNSSAAGMGSSPGEDGARTSPKHAVNIPHDLAAYLRTPAPGSPATAGQVALPEEFWSMLAQRAADNGLTSPAAGGGVSNSGSLGVELAPRGGLGSGAAAAAPAVGRVIPAPPGQPGPAPHNRKVDLYKTELCRQWEEKGTCRYGGKCQFAHGAHELRPVERHRLYKTQICRTYFLTGSCPYARRCCFVHMTPAMQAGATPDEEHTGASKPPLLARLKQQQSQQGQQSHPSRPQSSAMTPSSPRQRASSQSNSNSSADVAVSRLHEALSNAKAPVAEFVPRSRAAAHSTSPTASTH